LYRFGLSCRNVSKAITLLGCKGSKSSLKRDIARAGQKVKILHFQAPRLGVNILGMAGNKKVGILFVADDLRKVV